MWYNNDETTIKSTAGKLRSYLNVKSKIGYTKPIFVVSHLPLNYNMRCYNDGDAQYANYLFDVLNEAGFSAGVRSGVCDHQPPEQQLGDDQQFQGG